MQATRYCHVHDVTVVIVCLLLPDVLFDILPEFWVVRIVHVQHCIANNCVVTVRFLSRSGQIRPQLTAAKNKAYIESIADW